MAKQGTMKNTAALLCAEARELEYVEEDSTYYVTIQLGAATRWRQYAGGTWRQDDNIRLDRPGDKAYRHEPAIYERIGPFSGQMVNGLIGQHNRWREKNAGREPGGEVQRQILVLATEETTDEAVDGANKAMKFERMIRNIVRETVVAVMSELTKK